MVFVLGRRLVWGVRGIDMNRVGFVVTFVRCGYRCWYLVGYCDLCKVIVLF